MPRALRARLAPHEPNVASIRVLEKAGFERGETPDPTEEANLLRNSGRGLLMMEAFVDSVQFRRLDDGGTEVTMIKRLPAKAAG